MINREKKVFTTTEWIKIKRTSEEWMKTTPFNERCEDNVIFINGIPFLRMSDRVFLNILTNL